LYLNRDDLRSREGDRRDDPTGQPVDEDRVEARRCPVVHGEPATRQGCSCYDVATKVTAAVMRM
jgi:hypothetical protein